MHNQCLNCIPYRNLHILNNTQAFLLAVNSKGASLSKITGYVCTFQKDQLSNLLLNCINVYWLSKGMSGFDNTSVLGWDGSQAKCEQRSTKRPRFVGDFFFFKLHPSSTHLELSKLACLCFWILTTTLKWQITCFILNCKMGKMI